MRTGSQYLNRIRKDGRNVYVDGARVEDVTTHPAIQGIATTIAGLYDFAHDPVNGMQFLAPEIGKPANACYLIPRSVADLQHRRQAIAAWAGRTQGLVGRSPDHVGAFLAGFAGATEFFKHPTRPFDQNVARFYKEVLAQDLYVSYVIIPPQVDRSKTAKDWEDKFLQAGVVEEREDGIVIRGSQMLGTGTTVSDYLLCSCIVPLKPGDEDYANTFVVPVNAPGLKLYCRPPYGPGKPSTFDYPLSTRFDETDALVVFDNVFIPWKDVFVYRDVTKVREQFFKTPAHVLGNNQAQIRLTAKMKFLIGLARKIVAVNQIEAIPSVMEKLGELASLAAIVEGMEIASEATCLIDEYNVARPNPRFLYGVMGLQSELYPRAMQAFRELAGGGVLQVPSSFRDLTNAETKDDIERYVRSPGTTATERIKLFKLAWDLMGTEFGGRHLQYEMFYAGAPYIAKANAYRNYGYGEPLGIVERFLSGYALPEEKPQ
ncbi:MAG: 4-hydroxyphenylacetate 3-hydroxylase N-terminal domain-containing protein, partial [Planctomycetota bacterium]